jgi:tetratricopeptide (TPR) repeat protein
MYSESILGKKRTGSVKGFILGIATLLFLCLGVSSGFAQDISSQLKKIKELQARAAYDSARMLANFILSQPRLSTEDKQKILLSKQFSFYYLGKYDSLRAGLPILEKEIEEEHELYSELLLVRGLQKGEDGLYVAAIQDLLEAEKRVLAQKEQGVLGTIYNSLAGNFKDLEDYQKAKYYYRKAQDLFNQQGNTQSLVMVYNNVGGIYRKENLLDSALYVYDAASALLAELNNPFLLAQNTLNMGNVYEQKGDLKEAEAAFLRCLQLSESSKLQYGVLLSTLNLGNLYRLMGNYLKSGEWLKNALEQSIAMGLRKEKALVLERLSWLARDTGNYQEAYQQAIAARSIQDSLSSESVKKEVQALQEKFQHEKTQNELLILETKNQQATLGLLAAGIGMLLLVVFILYVLYRQKRLLAQKLIAESERESLSKTIQVKDMELTALALQLLQLKKRQEENGQQEDYAGDGEEKTSRFPGRESFDLLQQEFEHRITANNEDFYQKLLGAYPDLKPSELKLCSYLRLNLSTKELAEILNKSVRTIENTRFAIRKKMGLGPEDNLVGKLIAMESTATSTVDKS